MTFEPTPLAGAWLVDPERREDQRGFLARAFCQREFAQHGLVNQWVQMNVAHSVRKGILRGLHYQVAPSEEVKLVRCTRGVVWDVIVDLREDSPTYLRWFGALLSAENSRQLYVPANFAHGYQTLTDAAELSYLVSAFYSPGNERGIRWDDPAFGIAWPLNQPPELSVKDRAWPDYTPAIAETRTLRDSLGDCL